MTRKPASFDWRFVSIHALYRAKCGGRNLVYGFRSIPANASVEHPHSIPESSAALALLQPNRSGRILIVDDNRTNRLVCRGALRKDGYEIREAQDGVEAIESVAAERPDVIVLDVMRCEHLEKFSDYENRLPRGRTYVRNGSVCHLEIRKGQIAAKVSGSDIYNLTIDIKSLANATWKRVRESRAGRVASLLEPLQGKLSDQVMRVVTDRDMGLFPRPSEISLNCSCPDWAGMCKHVAEVMYGVGSRLDEQPELLFVLRGVDHNEPISTATAKSVPAKTPKTGRRTLDEGRLSEVFGIDLAPETSTAKATVARPQQPGKPVATSAAEPPQRARRRTGGVPAAVLAKIRQAGARRARPM